MSGAGKSSALKVLEDLGYEVVDNLPVTLIGGLVRGDKLLIAHHDVVIEPGDHVILFVMDKREMAQVSALFQTGATWL